MKSVLLPAAVALALATSGCSSMYYSGMEKIGIHKRDILVDRVEDTRDSQEEAQEQFASALEQFASVVEIRDSDLKSAYESLNAEYEASEEAADEVSDRIDDVEEVAEDLFEEWEDEIELYQNADLKRASQYQLDETRTRYAQMLSSMHNAEKSMEPVLTTFRDNVLFLKHNLNAQAIGSLKGEFANLKSDIATLIEQMNQSIDKSDEFIRDMREQG
ncbi:DUF2959 domain-containing protein [Granulosicoccaceae sp. 1_MG-2023]|nr:DUF2959 domain-containing protein [Granulosicoccaceae sp. 1_MG-2023]